jgi:hypothetical protein
MEIISCVIRAALLAAQEPPGAAQEGIADVVPC